MGEVHPIRAILAVTGWFATVGFLATGIEMPEAWWAMLGVVSVFYFKKD